MKIENFDVNEKVLIVAEVGNNHEGRYSLAEEMIRLAARAGANAVKFQTIVPERLIAPSQKERIAQLKQFQLSYEEFEKLSEVARKEKVIFLSTPFDIQSARFLNSLVPAFKIASGDNNFLPLIDEIARTGKPIILSTGMVGLKEVRDVLERVKGIWKEMKIEQKMAVLHCVVNYPTAPRDANLAAIKQLQQLRATVGYSDHTIGIEAAVLSVALGARIIEKHFTISKTYSDFRDHQLSADPDDFAQLVSRVRMAEEYLGTGEKRPLPCESDVVMKVRRSIVARCDLKQGTVVAWEHLDWVRPGNGLPPGEEHRLLGKRLRRSVIQGECLLPQDLE